MHNFIEQFHNAIKAADITPPDLIEADGKLRRFSSNGKQNNEAGWYVLHGGDIPAGCFGDWRTGVSRCWRADINRSLTSTEEAAHRAKLDIIRREREAEDILRKFEARTTAESIWNKAQLATDDHPYLIKKQVKANGLKMYKGALLIPLWDENKAIHSLQFINNDGEKRFLPGGRVTDCYFSIGTIKAAPALCIAEGFATSAAIHESTGYPVAVAFNAGNLLAVAKAMRRKFPILPLILCADDDYKTDGNPGLTKAKAAASAVNGMLAIPEFGENRPEWATDFNDMFKIKGLDAVRYCIDQTRPIIISDCADLSEEWPEPLPLTTKIPQDPYPLDALPETIRAAVIEVQAFTQAPIALVAASALGAISLACQTYVDIKRADKLCGPISLFLITIADSGERKSTCDGFFTKAIYDYEAKAIEAAKPLVKEYNAKLTAWQAKSDGIKAEIRKLAGKGQETQEEESDLLNLEYSKPQPPKIPKLIYSDVTPESLKYNLAAVWPSAGIVSSEGGIVFGSHGMGKDSVMRNLSTYNQGWDGKGIATDRRTSESFGSQEVRLTMAIQIQEITIKAFISQLGDLARGTGFFARVLFSCPESTQGSRKFTEAPENWPCLDRFNQRISTILSSTPPVDESGILTPKLISLATLAKLAWVKFYDGIESELHPSGELYDVRDVAAKAADNVARLAALFNLIEYGMDNDVGEETLNGASLIVLWHLNESKRFFGELALPVELSNAARLETWLVSYCRKHNVSKVLTREVQQYGPSGLRKIVAIKAAMNELQELGRARLNTDAKKSCVDVNPALLNDEG